MTAFRMKVNDLFKIGGKTIFVGDADMGPATVSEVPCVLQVDGRKIGDLLIGGEVLNGKGHRDLWTKSIVDIDRAVLDTHEVWLIAEEQRLARVGQNS